MLVHCSISCLANCIYTVPYFYHIDSLWPTSGTNNAINIRNYVRDLKTMDFSFSCNERDVRLEISVRPDSEIL